MPRIPSVRLTLLVVVFLLATVGTGRSGTSARQATPDEPIATAPIFLVYEALLSGDLTIIDWAVAPDFVDHHPAPNQAPGIEGVRQRVTNARASFPDIQLTVDDIFVEGDLVAVRTTVTGTQDGAFRGVAPTGKPVAFTVVDIWRLSDDKITEAWHVRDDLSILQQIGAMPSLGTGDAPLAATPEPGPDFESTSDAATIEANKAIAHRWNDEIWGQASQATLDAIVSPDLVFHETGAADDRSGLEESVAAVAAAFPDRRYTIDLLVAGGDKVAIVWSGTATQQGETFGVPPTGKPVTLDGIDILRIDGGQVVEAWSTSDNLGTLIQLGAFPPPGTPTT